MDVFTGHISDWPVRGVVTASVLLRHTCVLWQPASLVSVEFPGVPGGIAELPASTRSWRLLCRGHRDEKTLEVQVRSYLKHLRGKEDKISRDFVKDKDCSACHLLPVLVRAPRRVASGFWGLWNNSVLMPLLWWTDWTDAWISSHKQEASVETRNLDLFCFSHCAD